MSSGCGGFERETVETVEAETRYRSNKDAKSPTQRELKTEVVRSAEVQETSVELPQFPTKHGQSCVHAAAVVSRPLWNSPLLACVRGDLQTGKDIPVHWLFKCTKAQ